MDVFEAKAHLNLCERKELRDHAFGDREVSWYFEGKEVAGGYFGQQGQDVWITIYDSEGNESAVKSFSREDAYTLLHCGKLAQVERNDTQGEDIPRYGGY